jgi:protein-S-isoprenylcysteine O-methyltransferase Ste14
MGVSFMESPQIRLLAAVWKPLLGTVLVILLCAGRIDYWQGWVFIFANFAFHVVNVIAIWRKPDLAEERLRPGEGMKGWDKNILHAFRVLFYATIITAALDAGRYGLTPRFPIYFYFLSYALYFSGQCIHLWAKYANLFFSTVVRIQTNRNHSVSSEGPYRFVRHPGYLGTIVFTIATPLVLGSLWAFIPAILFVALAITRTYLEDAVLQEELLGYLEYSRRVRYRLSPGIW